MTQKLIAHMLGVTRDIAIRGAIKLQDAGLIDYKDGDRNCVIMTQRVKTRLSRSARPRPRTSKRV
jgi:Mn-dependent DtxR family transcriptional regulator